MSLTDIKLPIARGVRAGTLIKAAAKADLNGQWSKTNWAKKAVKQELRRNLSDFDRFKVMLLRKKKSMLVNKEFSKLRRATIKKK